jgi:hypothetical protein
MWAPGYPEFAVIERWLTRAEAALGAHYEQVGQRYHG